MTEVLDDDARARLYLEHREAIEERAALRNEGRELIEAALFTLEEPLAALASQHGAELYVATEDLRPSLTLYRPSWMSAQGLLVSVGLGWERRRLLVPGPYNEWAWTGVWVADDTFRRREALLGVLKKLRAPYGFSTSSGWSLWRYASPGTGELNPDAYAQEVLRQVEAVWAVTRDVIDQALT